MTWKKKLTSRKFLAAVGTFVTAVLSVLFDVDIPVEVAIGVSGVIATWIFSEAKLDGTAMAIDGNQKDQIIQALQGKLQEYAQEIQRLNTPPE